MKKRADVTLKRLSTTRWSAHYEAVRPLSEKFDEILESVKDLCNPSENKGTRGSPETVLCSMCEFWLCFLYFWSEMLKEVDEAQNYLQSKGISFDRTVIKIKALSKYLKTDRELLLDQALLKSMIKCHEFDIDSEMSKVKKKTNCRRANTRRRIDISTGD